MISLDQFNSRIKTSSSLNFKDNRSVIDNDSSEYKSKSQYRFFKDRKSQQSTQTGFFKESKTRSTTNFYRDLMNQSMN